ncbi:AAA family ATPase [Streptomyces sp. NPDC051987]|uniref:AAA family ATPase n=1 Tax=Streptomyces sp. NPDC051987 TaxID=3155808 RepID=UPI003439E96D
MTEEHVPSTFHRRLVVIAVSDYDTGTLAEREAFRAGISAQVSVVEDWWAGEGLEAERRFTPAAPPKPLLSVHDLRCFLIDQDLADADDDEALVVYITGHGLAPRGRQHFLQLPDTDENRPLGTAFPTAELIATALDSRAGHVLVMVDSCFSGRLTDELQDTLKALDEDRRALGSLVVLTAGNEDSRPRLQAFTSLLAAVRAHCEDQTNGYARSHLSWEDFHAIRAAVWDRTTMADIHRIWPPGDSVSLQLAGRALSPCLPNPGYSDTTLLEDARSQVGWNRADLDDYWISRATGQMSGSSPGWYFTGRAALVGRMIEFLDGDDGVLIVTGSAGSGKSALLARLVTLSDPRFRADDAYRPVLDAIPEHLHVPEGAVDAAVLARNTDPHELSAALYEALTGRPTPAGHDPIEELRVYVRAFMLRNGRPLTVVIDGIDEARNPRRIITDVLRPLATLRADGQPLIRLLLGIRSPAPASPDSSSANPAGPTGGDLLALLQRATDAGPAVRTDALTAQDDIAAYTASLLHADPQAGSRLLDRDDDRISRVATAVAEEVAPSFLDARLAAQQLHARNLLPQPTDLAWRRQLRQGTHELLRQDLADVALHGDATPEELLAVLRATAFAQGAGLPWADIWPAAVNALHPPCDDAAAAIRQVVRDSRLTGYLTTAQEDGRTVYRPIHERVSETLRTAPHTLLAPADTSATPTQDGAGTADTTTAHRQLTQAFARLLPRAPEQPPHPYLRRHLITHAALGNTVDDDHIPAHFLPWATRDNVRGSLGLPITATDRIRHLAAWARIEPFVGDAPPASRADSLALAQHTGSTQAHTPTRHPQLRPRFNHLHLPTNILAGTPANPYALATFRTTDDSVVLAAADERGNLTLWDPLSGSPFGTALEGLGPHARALTVLEDGRRPGEPSLIVGTDRGLWQCDPQTGEAAPLLEGRVRAVATFSDGARRRGRRGAYGWPLLAVATTEDLLLMDPVTGHIQTRRPLHSIGRLQREQDFGRRYRGPLVHALAVIPVPGAGPLLAIAQDGSYVPVVDALTFDDAGELPCAGRGASAVVGFATREGEPRLIVASRSTKSVRIWNPLTRVQHAQIRQAVASLALHPGPYGDPLLVTGSSVDGALHVFDTDTGVLVRQLPAEHTKMVRGLTVFTGSQGQPLLASASFDRTIRLWDLQAPAVDDDTDHPSADQVALLPHPSGPPSLISGGRAGEIAVRSVQTGRETHVLTPPDDRPYKDVTALTVLEPSPETTARIAIGYADGSVDLTTEEGARRVLLPSYYSNSRVRALARFPHPETGQSLLAAAISDSRIEYLRVDDDTPRLPTLRAEATVRALAVLPDTRSPLLAIATTRAVRLLHPGHDPHMGLPQRIGAVRSLTCLTTADGHLLATGGSDGVIRLWDPFAPRSETHPPLTGHQGPVTALAALPHLDIDRHMLVSACSDDTSIRVWDHHTGQEVLRLVTGAPITSLAVLPASSANRSTAPVVIVGSPTGTAAVTVHLQSPRGGTMLEDA